MAGSISFVIALRWLLLDLTDDESALVQVMLGAIRQQAIYHYIWSEPVLPKIYYVTI